MASLGHSRAQSAQYNWHGDAATFVEPPGSGGTDVTIFDPWGNPGGIGPALNRYRWNGGWGYLYFPDLGLYYAHGRWYNPDTGMWLSPNEKGDYIYGGDGQDAVNLSRSTDNSIGSGGGQGYTCDPATGCTVVMPLGLDPLNQHRLDKAVLFYSDLAGIAPDLVAATLAKELATDKRR